MVGVHKMSETIDKVLDAAKAVTTEPVMKVINQRLSNPFFLCFISSWVICNWDRVLLLLFSFSLDMEQRIDRVKALPSNSVFFGVSIPHTHTFWYPFIVTVIFVVGTPFFSYIVDIIQNEVLTKKNTNDSQRKKDVLDLKINEINKNVEYEYADAKARLNAENANKAIEYSTTALEEKFHDMQVKVRDLNTSIKEKGKEIEAQNVSYVQASTSLLKIREELDLKGQELVELNSKIISNQNKLDSIMQKISSYTLPFTNSNLGGLGSLNTVGTMGTLNSLNLDSVKKLGDEIQNLQVASQIRNDTVSVSGNLNPVKKAEDKLVDLTFNGDVKKEIIKSKPKGT